MSGPVLRDGDGICGSSKPPGPPQPLLFCLSLSFPGILAEVDNTHSPERSEAAFTFIAFKVLGTLETPWRALAGAVLCPADAGKEEHGSGLAFQ